MELKGFAMFPVFQYISFVFALLCSDFFCSGYAMQGMVKVVEAQQAVRSDIAETIRLTGTIQAKHSTLFTAKESGILQHKVQPGQKAVKNTVIAFLDNDRLAQTYELSLNATKIAQDQYDRFVTLSKTHTTSKQGVEDRHHQLIQAQKSAAAAKISLENTQFVAPFDGIVGVYKIREGSQVQAGDSIVTFYDPSAIMVAFDIPSTILPKINDGQRVFISGKELKIPSVQKAIDAETHMSPAYVDYPCENCIIGTTVHVDLVVAEKKDAIVVPTEAVFVKNGSKFVFIVRDEKAHQVPVQTGLHTCDKIEIISGVQVGDMVISRNVGRIYPEISVKIHQETPKEPPKESEKEAPKSDKTLEKTGSPS